MSISLQPFSDHHQEAVAEVHKSIFPEYHDGSVSWRPGQQFESPGEAAVKHVALDNSDGRVVGYASLRQTAPARYRLNLMVHPEWQGRGVGGTLFSQLAEDLGRLEAISANLRVRDDQLRALRFVEKRGFEEVHRMQGMVLHVPDVDLSKLRSLQRRLEVEGLVFRILSHEQARNEQWIEKLHELYNAVRPGWPNPDPTWEGDDISLEEFVDLANNIIKNPNRFFIADIGGRYIGFVGDLGTAVHPEFRGRGIATALKLLYVKRAREQGVKALYSNSANPALLAINRKLGYRPWHSEVRFVKRLGQSL